MGAKLIRIDPVMLLQKLSTGIAIHLIAEEVGCSEKTIYNRAKNAGWVFSASTGGKRVRIKASDTVKKRMCVCCGRHPVPTKPFHGVTLTRLCRECYREGENYGEW